MHLKSQVAVGTPPVLVHTRCPTSRHVVLPYLEAADYTKSQRSRKP